MLFGPNVPLNEYFVNKAVKYLQRGEDITIQAKRVEDIDLIKDIKYIVTSIHSQYQMDITKDDIHFWKFIDLIEGLHNTLIDRIRDIRNTDVTKIKDFKEKRRIIELKNHYALKKSYKIEQPKSLRELYSEIERG